MSIICCILTKFSTAMRILQAEGEKVGEIYWSNDYRSGVQEKFVFVFQGSDGFVDSKHCYFEDLSRKTSLCFALCLL
jgi:hypothetical protein